VYTPVADSEGRVEAILFSGLERRGFEELLTNRLLLFASITLLGVAISAALAFSSPGWSCDRWNCCATVSCSCPRRLQRRGAGHQR